MIKIFLDLDGVIANFDKEYHSYLPELTSFDEEKFYNAVTKHKIFEKLELLPNAQNLIDLIFGLEGAEVEVLSSLGSYNREIQIAGENQKNRWLDKHGIVCKRNFVNHWSEKVQFASHYRCLMIDDLKSVIDDFIKADSFGILYDYNRFEKAREDIISAHRILND
jgi:hypothetical protein